MTSCDSADVIDSNNENSFFDQVHSSEHKRDVNIIVEESINYANKFQKGGLIPKTFYDYELDLSYGYGANYQEDISYRKVIFAGINNLKFLDTLTRDTSVLLFKVVDTLNRNISHMPYWNISTHEMARNRKKEVKAFKKNH